jgi:S1-C subfamily serine protease
VALNDRPVRDASQVRNYLGLLAPGTSVSLSIIRDKQRQTVTVQLEGEAKGQSAPAALANSPLAGASLGPIPADNPLAGNVEGVYIAKVEPGSAAETIGIQAGDILTSADQTPVHDIAELAAIILGHKGKALLLGIQRGDASLMIVVR